MIKVLQLCKKSPLPTKDGESLAIHQITKAFALHNFHVDVLSMLTPKHQEHEKPTSNKQLQYHTVQVDTSASVLDALKNISSSTPYIVSRFYAASYAHQLKTLLQANTYDFIVLEGVFLALYLKTIKEHSKAKVILRAHNVEHQIWERVAQNEKHWLKKTYLKYFMNGKLKAFEQNALTQVDAILPISPLDAAYFNKIAKHKAMHTIPVCFEQTDTAPLPKTFSIGFLGGMDWLPNKNGVQWFIQEVWRPFIQKYPKAQFHLAGRNFPKDINAFQSEGLTVHGEIDCAADFIANQQVMIVPLFSGSGMRVKIIEATNLGRCVLSTSIGAEGIQYTNSENILIADTKKEWFLALEKLYNSPQIIAQIADKSKQLVAQNYNAKKQANSLINFMQKL